MKDLKYIFIIQLIILLIIGTGWVKNIVKLVKCDFEAPYKCEVIHGIGVIPPIGAVTGWLDIEE